MPIIDFPSSPTSGQQYTHDSRIVAWNVRVLIKQREIHRAAQ